MPELTNMKLEQRDRYASTKPFFIIKVASYSGETRIGLSIEGAFDILKVVRAKIKWRGLCVME